MRTWYECERKCKDSPLIRALKLACAKRTISLNCVNNRSKRFYNNNKNVSEEHTTAFEKTYLNGAREAGDDCDDKCRYRGDSYKTKENQYYYKIHNEEKF